MKCPNDLFDFYPIQHNEFVYKAKFNGGNMQIGTNYHDKNDNIQVMLLLKCKVGAFEMIFPPQFGFRNCP